MNRQGKQKLIKSLAPYIQKWLDDTKPNDSDITDIGFTGAQTVNLMSELVIAAFELNSEAQSYSIKTGLMH